MEAPSRAGAELHIVLGDTEIIPLSGVIGRHAYCSELGSLSPRLLSLNATPSVCKCHLASFGLSCQNWGLGNDANADTLATAIAMSNRALCVQPRSLVSSSSTHETGGLIVSL